VIGVAWAFLGAVFGAGVAYGAMRQKNEKTIRDVNGLGKKYGRLVGLLIRWADTDEKREQLAQAVEPPK
jgi:hypothetical protein